MQFHALRELHALRVIACLAADVREVTIAKYDLDSPSTSDEEFTRDLRWAIERRGRYVVGKRVRKLKIEESSIQ